MSQQALFYDRVEEAMAVVIDACGGRKAFAAQMYPDKPPRDAHNMLDAQLNPERREKFSPAQVVYVARRGCDVGCHVVVEYLCRESGYSVPQALKPEDAEAELKREFVEAVDRLAKIQAEIGRMQQGRRR